MTRMLLEVNGYTVLEADAGVKALKTATRYDGPIHLLLTDVIMPGMNGRQVYEDARKIYPSLKVLYMSGYTANVIAHHGILDPGIPFIQKPFSSADLADRIQQVLRNT